MLPPAASQWPKWWEQKSIYWICRIDRTQTAINVAFLDFDLCQERQSYINWKGNVLHFVKAIEHFLNKIISLFYFIFSGFFSFLFFSLWKLGINCLARVILGNGHYLLHHQQQIWSLGLNCPYLLGLFLVQSDLNLVMTLQNGMC